MKPEPAGVAHGKISRIEQLFGTPNGLSRRREREQSRDRLDVELALAPGTLGIRIIEEVRRRLVELLGHVLERSHRRPDLAELDRAHVRPREVGCAELRLRHAGRDPRLAQSLAELLECGRQRNGTPPSCANRRHANTLGRKTRACQSKIDRNVVAPLALDCLTVLGGTIRVLVVDDHPSVRENLRYLVNAERDMECVGVARDAQEAVRSCQELLPDVVILDDEMPGGRGLKVLEWIATELPDTRVVMYTLDVEVCDTARNLGAGCVLKDANYEVLVRAVRNAAASLPRSAETY
ncbi:MAG: response regulator transcription factor [Chloroflexi bacterium]|nr:MAG: response regulator transcription factor [Chloroflexota bacterium]